MPKYLTAERILFRDSQTGARTRGRITGWDGKAYRVVTDADERVRVHPRHVGNTAPDRILFVEGRLDRNLRSRRSFGEMFKTLLACYGSELLHEKVHTKEDLRAFLRREGRRADFRYIHIMAHGDKAEQPGHARLCLTHDKFRILDHLDLFEGLKGKVIILSACKLGHDTLTMHRIREVSQASAVIAYRLTVDDYYTNLTETLLYHEMIRNRRSPRKAVAIVREMLATGDIRISAHVTRSPVIRCFTRSGPY